MTGINHDFKTFQDERIRDNVVRGLRCQINLLGDDIHVNVMGARVALTGTVRRLPEKIVAEEIALGVFGVSSVQNDLEVDIVEERSDAQILRDVSHTIAIHSSVPANKVKVSVTGGVVTLNGMLEWDFQRISAQRVASAVPGVREIVNKLVVKPISPASSVIPELNKSLRT